MNDKIREVALQVAREMQEKSGYKVVDLDLLPNAHDFLASCLAELSKDVEPVAWMNPMNMVVMDHRRKINNPDRYSNFSEPLYLHPPLTEQDKLDAARYRWLRDIGQDKVEVFFATDKNASGWGVWDSHDDKDAAIDKAMENGK
jgi:hypothetical protein